MNWHFLQYAISLLLSLSLVSLFALRSTVFDNAIAIPAFFWLVFDSISFYSILLYSYIIFEVSFFWAVYIWVILFLIHSSNLCLLIGVFKPCILTIFGMFGISYTTICFVCSLFFYSPLSCFLLLLCDLNILIFHFHFITLILKNLFW